MIDCLPYIDKVPNDEIMRVINKMIEKEMKDVGIKKDKGNKDRKNAVKGVGKGKREVKEKKKGKIGVPVRSKYYNVEEWKKVFRDIDVEKEKVQNENFNLDLMNKYAVKMWDGYLEQLKGINKQLRNEKERLKEEITLINKKRKLEQCRYEKELETLDKKIIKGREIVDDLELKLTNKTI